MIYYLQMFSKFVLSNYYYLLFIPIVIYCFFQGKLLSWRVMNEILNILRLDGKVENDLFCEVNDLKGFKELLTDYYNCINKYTIYLALSIFAVLQFIAWFFVQDHDRLGLVERASINVLLLTITISLIEFRDNKRTSQKMKNGVDKEKENLLVTNSEIRNMSTLDEALDILVQSGSITAEEKKNIIKKESGNRKYRKYKK